MKATEATSCCRTQFLADVPTCDLNDELRRRLGIEARFLGPNDTNHLEVRGAC